MSLFPLLLSSPAGAQRARVEVFSVDRGLPSALILDLAQDATGRLWILSRGGVTVYDGRTMRTFAAADGVPPTLMGALDADAEGRVFVVTRSGARVLSMENGSWHALPDPPLGALQNNWGVALEVVGRDAGAGVAVGTTREGVWLWDGRRWRHGTGDAEPPFDHVIDLETAGDEVAVATSSGLYTIDPATARYRPVTADPRLAGPIFGLDAADKEGRLWVLGKNWLGYLEEGRLTLVTDDFELRGRDLANVGALAADPAGGVYFGSPARAYFIHPSQGEPRRLGPTQGLAGDGVTALLVDRESHVWLGSLRGLNKIESQRFLSYDREHGLLETEVTAVAEPAPGRFVLGHNSGLTFLGGPQARTLVLGVPPPEKPDACRVLDLAVDGTGTIWAAAQGLGLVKVDRPLAAQPDGSPVPLPGAEASSSVFSVEVDAQGTLWVTAGRFLFARPTAGDWRLEMAADGHEVGFLRWLATDASGGLYAAARKGLLWRDGEVWRHAHAPSKEADNVYTVFAASSGTVWAGTAAGLHELRGTELVPASRPALDRPVYMILEDVRGRIWFGTDDGVFIWNGRDLRHLTVRHGLAGRETNRGGGLVDRLGRVWIGTDQGVSTYQEEHDRAPATAPIVEVRAVEAAGERRPADMDLALAHHQSTLSFVVDTITFSREERVLYSYRLEGFDADWQAPAPLSGTEVRYTNLTPGTYRFRIKAGWPGGPWSAEAASATIAIASPLWRRPWFVGLAIAFAAIALLGGHGLRLRAVRRRNAELEAFNARLNASIEERQSLIAELERKNAELERFAYTVSHDLKSPLFTVQGFAGLLEKDAARGDPSRSGNYVAEIRKAAAKMGRLLDELLDLSRVGRVVNPSQDVDLAELTREAVAATSLDRRHVTVDVAPDLPGVYGDRMRLLEVMQNLIDNAAKYMGEQAAPRIEIGARRDGGELVIFVADNGIGIEPRYHEKIFGLFERLDPETHGSGVGLALVKRIVEYHGGRIWVESEGRGRGATFYFTLASKDDPARRNADP